MARTSLKGKKALVTGASRGVGRAIALALAGEGAEVFGTSRRPETLDWPPGVEALRFDLSSPEAVETSWEEAGLRRDPPSIVVNNAGSGVLAAFSEAPFEQWAEQIGLMLLAPMKLCHLALNTWTRARPGALVNVTSLATEYPIPLMSGYNAAKAGLSGFTESLILDADPAAAQVVELRLGDFKTEFNGHMRRFGDGERARRVWAAVEKRAALSPEPELAARRLMRALRSGRSGVTPAGSFFQTVLASIYGKFASHSAKRACNVAYYNLRSK